MFIFIWCLQPTFSKKNLVGCVHNNSIWHVNWNQWSEFKFQPNSFGPLWHKCHSKRYESIISFSNDGEIVRYTGISSLVWQPVLEKEDSKLYRKHLETNLIFFPQEEWLFPFLMKKKNMLKTVVTLILKGHSIFLLMQRNSVERYKSLYAHENCYKWCLALQWFSTSNWIFLWHCIFISVCWIFISLTWLIWLCNCPEMSCWTSTSSWTSQMFGKITDKD